MFKLIIFIRDMYTELFSCAKVLKNEVLLIVYSNSGLNFKYRWQTKSGRACTNDIRKQVKY